MRRNLAETGRWFCLALELLTNNEPPNLALGHAFHADIKVVASPSLDTSPFHVILQTELLDRYRNPPDLNRLHRPSAHH